MAADSFGNDLGAVGVPITGFLGFAPAGTAIPTPSEGADRNYVLPVAYKKAGLLTEDGGFEWTLEADGDPIVFWQDGYSIPSGVANAECVAKLAQYDDTVRLLAWGKTPDANGFITIDAGGHSLKFILFTEEIFKNGSIRRRVAEVTVKSAKVDKNSRGEVNGTELTFKANRLAALNNEHLGEWRIDPISTTVPTVSAASPTTSAAGGATVTITGTGFTGVTQVKFGSSNATSFTYVSPTQLTAVMPTGTAGSAAITVVAPAGTSTAYAYARS